MSIGRLRQSGDTIVEVLICIAIIGATLTVTLGIARRAQTGIREAEEKGQTTQLAQQQLERLKLYLKLNPQIETGYPTEAGVTPSRSILYQVDGQAGGAAVSGLQYGFCFYYSRGNNALTINYVKAVPAPIPYGEGPTDPICAVNAGGQFYCEVNVCTGGNRPTLDPNCSGPTASPATCSVDQAGYIYRAGIGYPPLADQFCSCGITPVPDQFFASGGLYAVGGLTTNQQNFDVIVVPYRIHQ